MSDDLNSLLPCPFCGGEPSISIGHKANGGEWKYIECLQCAACAETEFWNKREAAAAVRHRGRGMMVELRWKERQLPDLPGCNLLNRGKERTLQYRQWQVRIDASGAITPLPGQIEWTDWQDVPTVTEGAE